MGTNRQDIIEINGKKYDALTGRLISDSASNQPHKTQVKSPLKVHPKSGVALDGFVRSRTSKPAREHHPNHVAKPVQKSKTLMRQTVKKPQPARKMNTVSSGVHTAKAKIGPSPHLSRAAAVVPKSPLISHFGEQLHRSSVVKKVAHLPVKQPVNHAKTAPAVSRHTTPVVSLTRSHAASALIEKALATSTSHEQPEHTPVHPHKKRRISHRLGISSRAMALSSSILAGVLLGGFFAIQNIPNLSMRVAATRAGMQASMPGYSPSGFSFKGPINYTSGQVTVSFRSNTDDRSYSITQRESNWNSDALLANYVVAEGKQYQTYIDRGRTLYIYDGSNATWVDNGVWYQIEGPSNMTTDQLVRIASSI